jgi:hypothetical protein
MKTALRAAVPPNVKAKQPPAPGALEWHLFATRSEDESTVTLRASNRLELGTYPASSWRADAAIEAIETLGAAMHDVVVVHLAGKTTRIQIAKELGDDSDQK